MTLHEWIEVKAQMHEGKAIFFSTDSCLNLNSAEAVRC